MLKNKKGVFGLNALIMAGVGLMVLALVLTFSSGILQDEYDDRAADGDANVTLVAEKGIDGVVKFAKKQPTIAGAIVAVAIIGVILSVVGGLRLGR